MTRGFQCSTLAVAVLALISLASCGGGTGTGKILTPPPTYTIGGIISGLSGSGLILQDNGSSSLAVSGNGSFTFTTSVNGGSPYNVTVLTQPSNPSQSCSISNGTGTANANVTSIQVTCSTTTVSSYTIGGTISGLSGSGLVLEDNGGDNLTLAAGATSFTFATPIQAGKSYDVTVKTQPSNPMQTCSVSNAAGTANANVTSVSITCSATSYTIGGTISGLSGTVVLQDNATDNLTLTANGSFTFATAIASGGTYSVTVKTQPASQACSVASGSGTASANVTTVSVTCSTTTYTIGGTISGLSGTVVLQDNNSDNLTLTANGSFTFPTAIAAGGGYNVTVKTQPASQSCSVANGTGTATANVTSVQVTCTTSSTGGIQETFFGASFNFFTTWPPTDGLGHVATLGAIRLWDDEVKWGQINTAAGSYSWTLLDSYISMSQSLHADILYTFGDTPDYAGTIPKGNIHCLEPSDYSCSPPNDVNADGTGTDADFSNFVTALVTRYKGEISYYELWNEPDCSCYFAGTQAQMVRMNKDAAAIIRSIDPNARILSPSGHVWSLNTWFDEYIAAGGAPTFDIVNMHMRGNGTLNLTPEAFLGTYSNIVADVATNNLSSRPLWDSEHGIKADENLTDPNELAGYAARELILRASVGLPRQYLYSWDDNPPVGLQGNLGGTAYDTVAGWLIGHSISACTTSGTVYTCNVDDGQVVWDTAQSCSNGVCTYSNYTYPSTYKYETDLTDTKTALTGKTVPIGYEPIFLTAQ